MRIAMICSSFKPVPDVGGGAVEYLCTKLIEQNEKEELMKIDCYTIEDNRLKKYKYKNTKLIQVHITRFQRMICKVYNFYFKLVGNERRRRPYNEALIRHYLHGDYDYVLVENGMFIYQDICERTRYNNNLIFHLHGALDNPSFPKQLMPFISDTATKILTVSQYIKDEVLSAAPCANNVQVLYNCIDRELFNKNNIRDLGKIKKNFSIKENDIIIMYSGRINKNKGILELEKAFQMLCDKYENIKLLIVGAPWFEKVSDENYTSELKKEFRKIKDKIIFTGFISHDQMPEVYAMADMLVVPSIHEEAFGLVVIEALSMGVPVIATKSGGIPELLDDTCSILINKDSNLIENLAIAIETMINNPDKRRIMAQKALVRMDKVKEFNSKYYLDNFISIISKK